jgi:hypothetical protein
MTIYNSTLEFISFIKNLNYSTVFVEESFYLNIAGNVCLNVCDAPEYLLGAASVGNRVLGFFNKMPQTELKTIRGVCIFVSTELPNNISTPTFFCRTPTELAELFPLAIKTSLESNIVVHIIISANALNNYSETTFRTEMQDRISPYFDSKSANLIQSLKQIRHINERLTKEYNTLLEISPMDKFPERLSFEIPSEKFPKYIFPIESIQQRILFDDIRTIYCTPSEELFFHNLAKNTLKLNMAIETTLSGEKYPVKQSLCPGCPFIAIYNEPSINKYKVFSTIACNVVYERFGIEKTTFQTFLGMTSNKNLNIQPLIIAHLTEAKGQKVLPAAANFIFLKNDDVSLTPSLVSCKYPNKININCNMVFPYSCNNIKRYPKMKIHTKKCKPAAPFNCIEKSACQVLVISNGLINIDESRCTGCRSCARNCPYGVMS